jgi:hypothetical protein
MFDTKTAMKASVQSFSSVMSIVRMAMPLSALVSLVLITVATIGVDSPLRMSGGIVYVLGATVPLVVYGLIFTWAPTLRVMQGGRVLQLGTCVGIIGGALQIIHLALENFGRRVGENSIVTLAFMLGGFLIWGVAGYLVTREGGDVKAGIMASCWSAMVSVLMAVTFGLILMSANIPPPAYVATWSEFKQSGWSNAHAFAIANSLDAALSHLVVGPIAGTIFGILGVGVAKLLDRGAFPSFYSNHNR